MIDRAHPLARPTDPHTSKQAAAEIVADGTQSRMCQIALELVQKHPGRTAAELEQLSGLTDGKVRKRLADMKNRTPPLTRTGPDRRCTVTGKTAQTWYAAEATAPAPVQPTPKAGMLFDTSPTPDQLSAQRL